VAQRKRDQTRTTGRRIQFGFAYGGDQVGDYVGTAAYSPTDFSTHVFLTRVGAHVLYTLPPLSGKLADASNAHAVVPNLWADGTVVGGDSTTSSGNDHATLWTCAWNQAARPPSSASGSSAASNARVPSNPGLVEVARQAAVAVAS
jgi:hypothetical protein